MYMQCSTYGQLKFYLGEITVMKITLNNKRIYNLLFDVSFFLWHILIFEDLNVRVMRAN